MAYDLEEQEQIATLKAWWARHGNAVTIVLLIIAVVTVGWKVWGNYQSGRAMQAAQLFFNLQVAAQEKDVPQMKALTGELLDKYRATTYAHLGILVSAKTLLEMDDSKTAEAQLAWLAENGKNEFRDLARQRLAALQLDNKAYDEALKYLEKPGPGFEIHACELRGDIFAAQNKVDEAKAAYTEALDYLTAAGRQTEAAGHTNYLMEEVTAGQRRLLQQKIDALGVAV